MSAIMKAPFTKQTHGCHNFFKPLENHTDYVVCQSSSFMNYALLVNLLSLTAKLAKRHAKEWQCIDNKTQTVN